MDFFNRIFPVYLTATCRAFEIYRLQYDIERTRKVIQRLMESAWGRFDTKKDTHTVKLLWSKGLMDDVQYRQGYKQGKSLQLLGSVAEESKFPQNQQVARNMIRETDNCGLELPLRFKLKTKCKKVVTLGRFIKGNRFVVEFLDYLLSGMHLWNDRMKPILIIQWSG